MRDLHPTLVPTAAAFVLSLLGGSAQAHDGDVERGVGVRRDHAFVSTISGVSGVCPLPDPTDLAEWFPLADPAGLQAVIPS